MVKAALLMVTVPPPGLMPPDPEVSKVEDEGTVRVWAKLKLDLLVTLEEAARVTL